MSDNVNHPKHYQGKNECIDVMVAMFGVEAGKQLAEKLVRTKAVKEAVGDVLSEVGLK